MGSGSSKNPDIIQKTQKDTQNIRSSIKKGTLAISEKPHYQQKLINASKELDLFRHGKSKKKQEEIDKLQKLISIVSEELGMYSDAHLDQATSESNSFINVTSNRNRKSRRSSQDSLATITSRNKTSLPVKNLNKILDGIEEKLNKVKTDLEVAMKNDDNHTLRVQKKKVEMLSTDLELANIKEDSPLYEQKTKLENSLYRNYQKIVKRENQIKRTSKLDTRQRNPNIVNENINKLNEIEVNLQEKEDLIMSYINGGKMIDEIHMEEELKKMSDQLKNIQDEEKSVLKQKTILLKKLQQLTSKLKEFYNKSTNNEYDVSKIFQIQEQLKKIEEELEDPTAEYGEEIKLKLDSLQKMLETIPNTGQIIFRRVDETLRLCKEKLSKLENNQVDEPDMPRKSVSLEDLVELQNEWSSFQRNSSGKFEEFQKMDKLLSVMEITIKKKRQSLASFLNDPSNKTRSLPGRRNQRDNPVIKANVKIIDLPKADLRKSNNSLNMIDADITNGKGEDGVDESSSKSNRRSKIECTLEDLTVIADRVEEVGQKVYLFKGTSEDLEYNLYASTLLDKKALLVNEMQLTSHYQQVDEYKNNILEKIDYYLEYLKYKLQQNVLELEIQVKLKKLETRIERFTGSFKDVLYNKIEEDLIKCQREVSSIDTLKVNDAFNMQIQKLQKILDNKCGKKDDFGVNLSVIEDDAKKKLAEVAKDLQNVFSKIDSLHFEPVEEKLELENTLVLKSIELNNLKVQNATLYNDVMKLHDDIEKYKSVLKKQTNIKKQTIESNDGVNTDPNIASLNQIESELSKIRVEISKFNGSKASKEYKKLTNSLKEIYSRLEVINDSEHSSLAGNRLERLAHNVKELRNDLEQISIDVEKVENVENKIALIMKNIDDYDGKSEDTYNELDEALINLKIELQKLQICSQVEDNKNTCLNYIEYSIKSLNKKRNSVTISNSILV